MCAPAPRAAVVDHRSRAAGRRGRGSAQEAAMSEVVSMTQAPTACPTCGRDDIEWSDARDQLIAALVELQRKVEAPRKTGYNSHRQYRYSTLADILDACRPALAEAGLAILQTPIWGPRGLELVTTLAHTSGQWVRCRMPVLSVSDPQAMGSALTYSRKYSILTIVGLAPDDDDDGEGAMPRPQPTPARAPQTRAARPQAAGRAPPQPTTAAQAQAAPTAAPEVDVAAWTRRIHAARTRDDLAALTREMASAIPEAHPARDQLRREVQRRQDAIAYAESQARGLDRHW